MAAGGHEPKPWAWLPVDRAGSYAGHGLLCPNPASWNTDRMVGAQSPGMGWPYIPKPLSFLEEEERPY